MRPVCYILLSCLLSLILILRCNLRSQPAGYLISDLDNIREIKIFLNQDEPILQLTNAEDIRYFLSTFKSTKTNNASSFLPIEFKADGSIAIVENTGKELFIKIDMDRGYHVKLKGKDYFENFTYLTGRYLSEIDY